MKPIEKKTKKKKEVMPMWGKYSVTMDFAYRLCGSVPQSKEIVPDWIKSRMPKNKPEDGKSAEEIEAEVIAELEKVELKTTVGFMKDDSGLWVRGGTIKAHLKDCANQVKDIDLVDVKTFRSKVANAVHIKEYKVHLRNGTEIIQDYCDSYEQPIHIFVVGQGPRSALKVINYAIKPTLKFTMLILQHKEVTLETVTRIFEYGSIHGYGGERGMGEGRYTFRIERAK